VRNWRGNVTCINIRRRTYIARANSKKRKERNPEKERDVSLLVLGRGKRDRTGGREGFEREGSQKILSSEEGNYKGGGGGSGGKYNYAPDLIVFIKKGEKGGGEERGRGAGLARTIIEGEKKKKFWLANPFPCGKETIVAGEGRDV